MHVTTRDAKVIDRFVRGPKGYALERFCEWYFASYGFGPVKKIHRTRQIVKTFVNHERRIKKRMKQMDFYWQDLNEDCQKRLFDFLGGENGNYDVYPFATLEIEEDEEE